MTAIMLPVAQPLVIVDPSLFNVGQQHSLLINTLNVGYPSSYTWHIGTGVII